MQDEAIFNEHLSKLGLNPNDLPVLGKVVSVRQNGEVKTYTDYFVFALDRYCPFTGIDSAAAKVALNGIEKINLYSNTKGGTLSLKDGKASQYIPLSIDDLAEFMRVHSLKVVPEE